MIRKIDEKLRKDLIYHGPGIPEQKNELSNSQMVQQLMSAFFHGAYFSASMMQKQALKALFISHDKDLAKRFQNELQRKIQNLSKNFPKNSQEEIVWRAFLGNIIAFLPFCYPKTGDKLTIPLIEDGVCRQIDYQIEVLPLNYSPSPSPMAALGLIPLECPQAPPILVFMPTTFPAGDGFIATVLADFTPGHSVGEIIYKRNREKIQNWLADKKNVQLIGMSLGGAMAFHTLRNNHQINRIDIYNPPGLYSQNWKKGIGTTCKVNIYCQPGDLVSTLGAWPNGDNASLYSIFAHQVGVHDNPLSSHARAFTGCKKITIIKEDPHLQNQSLKRYLLTKAHQLLGPLVVFLPISASLFIYQLSKKRTLS